VKHGPRWFLVVQISGGFSLFRSPRQQRRSQRSGGATMVVFGCWLFRSPRWFLVVQISGGFWFRSPRQQRRSQRSGGATTVVFGCWLFRSPRWFLVVQISGGFWFRSPWQQLVFFGAKQQFGKVKNIIFKCGIPEPAQHSCETHV
jgi:hypothetical protein